MSTVPVLVVLFERSLLAKKQMTLALHLSTRVHSKGQWKRVRPGMPTWSRVHAWVASSVQGFWKANVFIECEETIDKALSACLANDTCFVGNRGPLCAACAPGYFKRIGQFRCERCFEDENLSHIFLWVMLVVALGVVAIITGLTIQGGGKAGAIDIVIAKIGLNHLIIASTARLFPLSWPPFVQAFFTVMTVTSASALGESGLSSDCIIRSGAIRPVHARGLMATIGILAILFIQFAFWAAWRRCKEGTVGQHGPHVSLLVTLLLAHPMLTRAGVALIACRRVDGVAYLAADVSVACSGGEYLAWFGLAFPMILLFSIGIPTAYFIILRRHVLNKTLEAHRPIYGYLTSGYRSNVYWFELWNTVRKGLFTAFAVVFEPLGVHMQTWVHFTTSFFAVFSYTHPYDIIFVNRLELQGLRRTY